MRYDTILRSKINVRAWTQKNYVPTPRARHPKVYGTRSYDPSTVSGKEYFWTTEQASRDLCPLFGVWHGLRFNIFFCFFPLRSCGCNDPLLSDPLSSVAIPRRRSSTRQFNSRYPHSTSQPHETPRQFVTPTRRTRQKSNAGGSIFCSSIAAPTLLTPGTVNLMPGTVIVMLGAINFMSGTVAVLVANFYVDVSF